MSFYKWGNVSQQSSQGWTSGDLFTDDPAFFHVLGITGKTLYINNMPFGKILSTDFKPAGTGTYTLQRWASWAVLDDTDPNIITTSADFIGITAISAWHYDTPITSIELRDHYYFLGRLPVQIGDVLAERNITLYTDDPAVMSASINSLIGQELYADGVLLGTITANKIFDASDPNTSAYFGLYITGGQVGETVNASGKVLMQVEIQLDVSIGNVNLPSNITKVTTGPAIVGEWLYTTETMLDGFTYKQGEYGCLYHPGKLADDYLTLAADNTELWESIKGGNLGLYLNGKFVAPIIDLRSGFGYQHPETAGQNLPASPVKNPWSLYRRTGFYMTSLISNPADFRTPITKVEFKPYYRTSSANGKFYISVTAAPNGASDSPMPALVNACVADQTLFIDCKPVGTITAWGCKDLAVDDGKVPVNFAGFTGNHSAPSFKEFFFEVAEPTRTPVTDQTVRVSVDNAGVLGDGELINGCVVLKDVPNIKEGINGLVGKRLIINEIYIGLVISNTLDSITTGLTPAHDIPNVPLSIAGIWRLETVDNIGRIPLSIAHVMSVSDLLHYPSFSVVGKGYDVDYPYDPGSITHYPNGTLIYTRRDGQDVNQYSPTVIGHELPGWLEHAELTPETSTFRLNNTPNTDIDLPAITKYIMLPGSVITSGEVMFRKMWQWGSIKVVPYAALKGQPALALVYYNQPGELDKPSSITTDLCGFRLVPDVTTVINYGEYNPDLHYETGALVEWNGNVYVKLSGSTDNAIGTWQLVNISVDPNNHTPHTLIILATGSFYVGEDGLQYPVVVVDTLVDGNARVLCSNQMFYVAAAPRDISLDGAVVEYTTPTIVEEGCTVIEFVGCKEDRAEANVMEYISSIAQLTSSAPSMMTPFITSSVSIQGGASPAKQGATIQLKRGNKANLPSSAAVGEPLVTLDTGELFVGTGSSLRKISDIMVSETEPAAEDRNKLWYNPIANETRIYKDGSWQVTGAEASMDYGDF